MKYRFDDAAKIALQKPTSGSHLKVYIPILPHAYILRMINGTLLRVNGSEQGWEYLYAKSHEKKDELTYDFTLVQNAFFQDGSVFDANAVVENFEYFLKSPITYTNIHKRLLKVEKLNKYKVRFHLSHPYPMFLNDLGRISLYTSLYLKQNAWEGRGVGYNTEAVGAYGLGPYILTKGIAKGTIQDSKIELQANPYYLKKDTPFVEKITVYTQLASKKVIEMITQEEGALDVAFIPFNKKVEVLTSEYSKLVTRPSRNTYTINFNLQKKNGVLLDKNVRLALNQVINQERLIKFVYKNEAVYSPFPVSSNISSIKKILKDYVPKKRFTKTQLHEILNGVELTVVTQDLFMELWQGLQYQFEKYGVKLNFQVTSNEKEVLSLLFDNGKSTEKWDMLIWGNTDWYGNHPWPYFMVLRSSNIWSSIEYDAILDKKLEDFFLLTPNTKAFDAKVKEILLYAQNKAYLLSVPSPNVVLALNKEVYLEPSSSGILPLWNAKVTPYHWSVRKTKYAPKRKVPVLPVRFELEH